MALSNIQRGSKHTRAAPVAGSQGTTSFFIVAAASSNHLTVNRLPDRSQLPLYYFIVHSARQVISNACRAIICLLPLRSQSPKVRPAPPPAAKVAHVSTSLTPLFGRYSSGAVQPCPIRHYLTKYLPVRVGSGRPCFLPLSPASVSGFLAGHFVFFFLLPWAPRPRLNQPHQLTHPLASCSAQ